jgi:chromosome partitioning protein
LVIAIVLEPVYTPCMRTILIFSGKGGCSKTTVARELAVAGGLAGRTVALADLDPQAGLTGWFARRTAETPAMVKLPADYNLATIAATGIDELIIDLPPGVPTYVAKLISQADAVLVPCRPSPDDLSAAAGVVGALGKHPQWAFILAQTLPRSRLSDGALRQLAALGKVAPISLGLRQDYPSAAVDGLAAVEFAGTKSADEVTQLRAYVNKMIGFEDGKKAGR